MFAAADHRHREDDGDRRHDWTYSEGRPPPFEHRERAASRGRDSDQDDGRRRVPRRHGHQQRRRRDRGDQHRAACSHRVREPVAGTMVRSAPHRTLTRRVPGGARARPTHLAPARIVGDAGEWTMRRTGHARLACGHQVPDDAHQGQHRVGTIARTCAFASRRRRSSSGTNPASSATCRPAETRTSAAPGARQPYPDRSGNVRRRTTSAR